MPKSDSPQLFVRPARASDVEAWFVLWHGYCAELGGVVSEIIAEGIWQRILAPAELTGCLFAYRTEGEPLSTTPGKGPGPDGLAT